MTSASTLDSVHVHASSPTVAHDGDATRELGEAIAELSARLHAATYELLVMLREFDARVGWNNGFLSCAHWLHWRTSIALGACRERVRVAKALAALPLTSATMQRGAVSYAKVRALTRVATAANERRLVDLALAGTAAQVERFVRAWRRVDRAEAGHLANAQHLGRHLSTWVDDDGMVVIRGRLTPEVGAVVQRALEAAADHLFRGASGPQRDLPSARKSQPDSAGQMHSDCWRRRPCRQISTVDLPVTAIRSSCMWALTKQPTRYAPLRPQLRPRPSMGCSKRPSGRRTFPRKRHSGSSAMHRSSRCEATAAPQCSTWGGRPAQFRRQSGALSVRETGAAASPAARRGGAMRIMCDIGPMAARPVSKT